MGAREGPPTRSRPGLTRATIEVYLFLAKMLLNDGGSLTQNRWEKKIIDIFFSFCGINSRRVPRPRDFSSRSSVIFSPKSVFGRGLS